MKSKNLLGNDDAVSVSVGFIIMFAVTVILFTGLIISFYTLTRNTEKSSMGESFKIMGYRMSADINMVDTMVSFINSNGGNVNALEYEFSLPASVAGKSYTVNITSSIHEIIIDSDNNARTVSPFNTSTNFTDIKIYSGAEIHKLKYDTFNRSIIVVEQ
jgi:FlaG/FlaF family flagellin (archaellin)